MYSEIDRSIANGIFILRKSLSAVEIQPWPAEVQSAAKCHFHMAKIIFGVVLAKSGKIVVVVVGVGVVVVVLVVVVVEVAEVGVGVVVVVAVAVAVAAI